MCSATSEDEQAVSTVTAGPSRPKLYATRPETTLVVVPVSRNPSSSGVIEPP
jgi:hypothetical protein